MRNNERKKQEEVKKVSAIRKLKGTSKLNDGTL
jgi:hypothetical protein